MNNNSMGLLLLIFCAFGLPVTVLSIRKCRDSDISIWFTLLCCGNILWALMNATEYLIPSDHLALFIHNVRFSLIGATSVLTYVVVLGVLKRKQLSGKGLASLMVFPLCTLLVTICDFAFDTHLMNINGYYELVNGVRVARIQEGIWFWLHCVFCYVLLAAATAMMLRHLARMPKRYRTTVSVLLCCVALSMVMTVLAILQVLPYGFDATPITAILSQTLYYFVVFHPQSVDQLVSSREIVFEKAVHPILVLDNNKRIVDCNAYAAKVGRSIGIEHMQDVDYDVFFQGWLTHSNAHIAEDTPSIFTIHEEEGDVHYQVETNRIDSGTQKAQGIHVEIKNITPAMGLVHKLQAAAYFDDLTGLRNRNCFIRDSQEHDREAFLPLGVLVGDMNNLKYVNDTWGHIRGDMFLQMIADILNDCKPKDTVVYRVGGDEFIAITMRADTVEMDRFVADVRKRCLQVEEQEQQPLSIALGYLLKTDMSQSIQDVIHRADMDMYKDKNDRRRRQ